MNIQYKITTDDKEQILFDFYMLTYLRRLPLKNKKVVARDNIKIRQSLIEATNNIVEYLHNHLKNCIVFACSAEFRHILDFNKPDKLKEYFQNKNLEQFICDYATKYAIYDDPIISQYIPDTDVGRAKENISNYVSSYKALMSTNLPIKQLIQIMSDSFVDVDWELDYGGEEWQGIAQGWVLLDNAKTYTEKVIAIDHAYDLQHNTGSIFEKLDSYYKASKSGYEWIKKALDFKRDIKDVWDLYEKSSFSVRKLAGYIAKDYGYGTYEMYLKNQPDISDIDSDISDNFVTYRIEYSDISEYNPFKFNAKSCTVPRVWK